MKVKKIQSEEKSFLKYLENKKLPRAIIFGQRPFVKDEKFEEGDIMEVAIIGKDLSIIYSEAPAFVKGNFTDKFNQKLKDHGIDKDRMRTDTNFEELISNLMVSSSLEHIGKFRTFSLDGLKDKFENYEVAPDSEAFQNLREVVNFSHFFYSSEKESEYDCISLEFLSERGIKQVEQAIEFVKTCSLTPIQDAFKIWLDSLGPNNFTPITKGCKQPVMKEIRDSKKERPDLDEKTKVMLREIARNLITKK